ncbi:hypothetical protein M758_N022200 [Ceratodon purpureus]|nr:hypothetical protein M758_N022200 [Ceratodon purpureus]
MAEASGIPFIDDFFLLSDLKHPSLLEVPFANAKLWWERSGAGPIHVNGKCNGEFYASLEIDMWGLQIPSEGRPTVLVRRATGAWMELRDPRDFYLETMRSVLVGAYFLTRAKQSPNSTKGDVWRYLRKECGNLKPRPHERDLIEAFLLCRSVASSDRELQKSPIIRQFYPSFNTKPNLRVPQDSHGSGKWLQVINQFPATPQDPTFGVQRVAKAEPNFEACRSAVGVPKGPSSPQFCTPNTHTRPAEYRVVHSSSGNSRSRFTPEMQIPTVHEDKPGIADIRRGGTCPPSIPRAHHGRAPPFETTPSIPFHFEVGTSLQTMHEILRARRRSQSLLGTRGLIEFTGDRSDVHSAAREEEWTDEPDVCAFCDDGVEKGDRLLCCDGPCMRSFHPTVRSGMDGQCPSLGLSTSAFASETWMCPNCEAGQHQCFACGKLGNSNPSTHSQLELVFECGSRGCKRFYHPPCVAELLLPEDVEPKLDLVAERNDLACRILEKSESFICPLHTCASCNMDEDKTDPRRRLLKCRRCPAAWHDICLPEECRTRMWLLEDGKHVMYCGRHALDPELLTPERDHIIFPIPRRDQSTSLHSKSILR